MSGRTVYVTRAGATLRREGERLRVVSKDSPASDVSVHDLAQLVLMGNITVTPAALDLLVERGVDTVWLSGTGRYRGRIIGGPSRQVALRLAQFRALEDDVTRKRLARSFVRGKVRNQRTLLLQHARRHGESPAMEAARASMRLALTRLDDMEDLDAIRGLEGRCAVAYFAAFGDLLRTDELRFDGRNRRPPLDPVNALLSLGYTLVTSQVEAALGRVGLDPYLGALHAPLNGRPSLACDLVEELRAPLVDAFVVASINRRAFRPEDFEEAAAGEPVYLRRESLRWFLTLFERRMAKPVWYEPLGCRLAPRDLIEAQARAFARDVLGGEAYEPFRSR
ncbi:MAG: CRISPR-associated endonuclease Cas1 [Polyangiales bacterium]